MRSRGALASLVLFASACSTGMGDGIDADLIPPLDGRVADGATGTRDAAPDAPPRPTDAGVMMDASWSADGSVGERTCEAETCFDGLDEDCDGTVDEGCPCVPGEVGACFRGDPAHRGVGACGDGSYVCEGSAEFGSWGPCEGDVVADDEVCDLGGVDEDCDGASNEDCECFDGDPPLPCGTDAGECAMGMQRCVGGRRTACEGAIGPSVETCNGLDDDCDGTIDDGVRRACGSSVGTCRMGIETCAAGAWGACTGGRDPIDEICDGLDNDCDAAVDEAVERACGMDVGRCIAGLETCAGGAFGDCVGRVDPIGELCNGVDDDCDGTVDEGVMRACGSSDVGACRRGAEICSGGSWSSCEGAVEPAAEACDGSADDDCDGSVDEGCACTDGASRPCGTDVGACVAGTESCAAGAWSVCSGRVGPVAESCNAIDDDCDGATDESITRSCGSTDLGVCAFGTETCSDGSFGPCAGAVLPGAEACDGALDEDCDGAIDEGCECVSGATRSCGTDVGACAAGSETCDSSGRWGACSGRIDPMGESCNAIDDDCDGAVDEALTRSCGVTDVGVCMRGTETCGGGAWGSCMGVVLPGAELCDGILDEDCDGLVDEGCECITGATRSCGSDVGACASGLETCDGAGRWGACEGATGPAPEGCNALDDDCDSLVDEALSRSCGVTDVGACSLGTESCSAGAWGSCVGRTDPSVELCEGVDDEDCDGAVDEGCGCTSGSTRACGSDVGACAAGTQTCALDGTWGTCTGAVGPSPEACDGSVDEDCDGLVDEGCDCVTGATRSCGSDVGACVAGTETCDGAGRWGACTGATGPGIETCDAIDDDCDGAVDEMLVRGCGTDVGACSSGTETCSAGAWGSCTGAVGPSTEQCDGSIDEDCDGSTDEGCLCTNGQTRGCGTDVGACVSGSETCDLSGTWGACAGAVGPSAESCNAIDDDCDASVDESLTRSCGTDVGECVRGTQTCSAGGWGICAGEVGPSLERCDGSADEDCDGSVDEGCLCTNGQTRSCGTDVGACASGTETCDLSGSWGACAGATGPTAESCNAIDDDCDASVDESLTRSCGTDVGECVRGTQACSAGGWGSCAGEVGPSPELCDGTADEDCDGSVDDGCLCTNGQTRSCGTDVGACVSGTETCDLSGTWGACAGATGPSAEVCNGTDDDCDSRVDEGACMPPTVTCPAGAMTMVGTTVMLAGSGSDPDGGAVTYLWTVSSAPLGSSAAPSPATAASTSFTPDAAGSYTLRLCVTDDEGETACCTTSVSATSPCVAPSPPVLTVCPTSWDRRPIVQFAPLPAGVTYELYVSGESAPYDVVTLDGQNYHRPSGALGTGSPPPGTSTDLYAVACLDSDPMCCSVSGAVSTRLVESCTTPVAPSADRVIFSEYVINGDGACPGGSCEAGEAIEITNLSHCPVALDGHHFSYCNPSSCSAFRWMDFTATDVIPPRGVYVAIRNQSASMCAYPFFGPDDPGLFGLKISTLTMQGDNLASGWFANGGGGMSRLRIASGAFVDMTTGTTIDLIAPYSGAAPECSSTGFDAYGACGAISAVSTPTDVLTPNQLGRLWHPCDAVLSPFPAGCR